VARLSTEQWRCMSISSHRVPPLSTQVAGRCLPQRKEDIGFGKTANAWTESLSWVLMRGTQQLGTSVVSTVWA
jgi:hypothetical protein